MGLTEPLPILAIHQAAPIAAPAGGVPSADGLQSADGLMARMEQFYAAVDAEVAGHRPVCVNRGACCRFDEYGHRLYVTAVELAYFVARQSVHGLRAVAADDGCPYQQAGACTARDHRPLGCRVFFCDPATRDWQGPLYERQLAALRQIGDEYDMPYRYVEWRAALRSAMPGDP
ncbi:MAG: hypothetical protein U1A27_07175 [Phycisphaerae bacterium]